MKKGLLLGCGGSIALVVMMLTITFNRWNAQGYKVVFLSPREWRIGAIEYDCMDGGGTAYFYGVISREPKEDGCHR